MSSWQSFGFFDLEGCNASVVAISTPPNSLGHLILYLWGPEAAGPFIFHVAVSLVVLILHAFSGSITVLDTLYSLGLIGWFFVPSFCVTGHFILILLGLAALLCAIYGSKVNTLVEDGNGTNTFSAFNPTQAEKASIVIANQFWSQIFGIAFMFSHHLWTGSADESVNQINILYCCMSRELLEFDSATLGSASNPETSYVGDV